MTVTPANGGPNSWCSGRLLSRGVPARELARVPCPAACYIVSSGRGVASCSPDVVGLRLASLGSAQVGP